MYVEWAVGKRVGNPRAFCVGCWPRMLQAPIALKLYESVTPNPWPMAPAQCAYESIENLAYIYLESVV